jgi:hypothetical protein
LVVPAEETLIRETVERPKVQVSVGVVISKNTLGLTNTLLSGRTLVFRRAMVFGVDPCQ